MKTYILIPILFLSLLSFGQTGSVQIQCIDKNTLQPLSNIQVEIIDDSICFEDRTTTDGTVLFRHVPFGEAKVWFTSGTTHNIQSSYIIIQENQVLQTSFFIDTAFLNLDNRDGSTAEFDKNGHHQSMTKVGGNLVSKTAYVDGIKVMSTSGVMEIACVEVVSYRLPLIDKDGGASGATITREDISKMPMRMPSQVASTVGGVISSEQTGELNIRGARSYGTTYYLDGMRVENVDGLPKSSIYSTQVITGGIPANYGDVTGGIVNVTTKSPKMNGYVPYSPTRRTRRLSSQLQHENAQARDEGPRFTQADYDEFLPIYENDFLSPMAHPNSTFGIDVDQASWGYVKTRIENGYHIQRDAVKLEEMINSFDYQDVVVPEYELMHVSLNRYHCDWNPSNELVSIHLQAKELPKDLPRKVHNLVLLVDVSGSMTSPNKLPLLVKGMKQFINTLDERDVVSIVTYAGSSGVALQPTRCNNKRKILQVLDGLSSGGSTNGIGGIKTAYELAEKNYDPSLNNRIILCTDGDFNVGINSVGDLENYIATKRGKGIYLTALGFGMGNYKNNKLETLADKGDGNHFYINNLAACQKVLVEDIGNLLNIARDVKLNVEFNPNLVKEYRLIGYENRLLKPRDFEDDTKDAGEIGYGHKVTAVYEIVPGKAEKEKNHFVKSKDGMNYKELAFVKLRYKAFEDSCSVERRYSLPTSQVITNNSLLNAVIGFGLYLRNSVFKGNVNEAWLMDKADIIGSKEPELSNIIKQYCRKES